MKIKSICCDYEFDVKYVSKDSLGYCTTCPCCHGSFDVDMRMLTLTEFFSLKKKDKVFVRIHDTLVKSEVMNKPFYNSDADEPDWEVETSNGFCDMYSVYKLNDEIKKGNNNMIKFTTMNVDGEYKFWNYNSIEELKEMYYAEDYDGPSGEDPVTEMLICDIPVYVKDFDSIVDLFNI